MNVRWRMLLSLVLVAAIALAVIVRLPRRAPAATPEPLPRPESTLSLVWRDDALDPETAGVPKDHRVRLTITNASRDTLDLTLQGYADRVHPRVAPGATWNDAFVSDLPGEAFAWMAGSRVVGRL